MPTRYLDITDVLLIAERLTGESAVEIQRRSRPQDIEAALLEPSAELDGVERYPELHDKAAALLRAALHFCGSIPRTRQLAWVVMREFLARNDALWQAGDEDPASILR